tara:strand:+ start:149 stop:697 length:549 start_codon:yes stop_codon:yes gene_type:complete
MLLEESKLLCFIIDVQEKLLPKIHNNKSLTNEISLFLQIVNTLNIPLILTEQYPKGLGKTVDIIESNIKTSSFFKFEKKSFSCLGADAIQSQISNLAKKQVLLCGIETHICVLQTASDLINSGYDVFILNECVSSRNESDMRMGISRLKKFGCSIITHEMLAFELLKSSTHPNFKDISVLIK